MVIVLLLSVRNDAQLGRPAGVPPAPSVRIEGRVVADETGIPIPNARVGPTFGTTDRVMQVATSDGEGHFVLSLPQGRYNIAASKSGFARHEVPQSPDGQPLEIRLPRAAAISGRVIDEYGDPVAGASVQLEMPPDGTGDRWPIRTTSTDDLGEYRFGGLADGTFLPVVVTRGRYAVEKTYLAGAKTAADAPAVSLHVGEERDGLDFVLTAPQALSQPFAVDAIAANMPSQWALPPPGSGTIRGRISTVAGNAIGQAHVMLTGPRIQNGRPTLPYIGRTAVDGRFEFANLGPGRYQLLVSRTGYLPVNPATQKLDGSPASPTIELTSGETRDRTDVALTKFGTLTGRVLDEYGFPVMGARVQLLHVRFEGGRRKLIGVDLPPRLTDDRGDYRLYGLESGQYIVSAFIGDVSTDDLPGYARTYFPGTATVSDAQFVPVGAEQNVAGMDITLVRTRTARVSGRWVDSQGRPSGGSLMLMPSWRASATPAEPTGARILPDGQFEFRNVSPGEYVIQAYRGRSSIWSEGEFGALPVLVTGTDIDDLLLQTSVGSTASGRITFDTADQTKLPAASAIEITAVPSDPDLSPGGAWATARIGGDWTFAMSGLSGPRRLIAARLPRGWVLKEIRADGVDATDRPIAFGRPDQSQFGIEIVLSARVSQLTGTVSDENNRTVANAHVIVFAADRDHWFYRSRYVREAITDEQGAYTIAGLPFGTYYLTTASAISAEGPDAWQDAAFLTAQISRSALVTISEGQRVTRAIRVTGR